MTMILVSTMNHSVYRLSRAPMATIRASTTSSASANTSRPVGLPATPVRADGTLIQSIPAREPTSSTSCVAYSDHARLTTAAASWSSRMRAQPITQAQISPNATYVKEYALPATGMVEDSSA